MAKKSKTKSAKRRRPPLYIPLGRLFLDPQNPRLPKEAQGMREPELVQVLYERFNLEELADSMAENGYFDEEPLVGIPKKLPKALANAGPDDSKYRAFIENPTTSFTVVEGNRRAATAKLLLDETARNKLGAKAWPKVSAATRNSLSELPIIVYPERDEVLAYLGVRHIVGIQKWGPFARASYIAQMIKDGRQLSVIQQQIGDRRRSARKIYFCYRLIEEMEDVFELDTEKAKNYFSYLVLSIGQRPIKEFLGIPKGWADISFDDPVPEDKLDNLKFLFSWLFGEGKRKLPVIKESRDITNKLSPILRNPEAVEHLKLTRDLDDAYERSDGEKELLLKNLKKANKSLERSLSLIPQYKIPEVKQEMKRCTKTVADISKLLES